MGIRVNEVINQRSTSGAYDGLVTEHEGQQSRGGSLSFSCLTYTDQASVPNGGHDCHDSALISGSLGFVRLFPGQRGPRVRKVSGLNNE